MINNLIYQEKDFMLNFGHGIDLRQSPQQSVVLLNFLKTLKSFQQTCIQNFWTAYLAGRKSSDVNGIGTKIIKAKTMNKLS